MDKFRLFGGVALITFFVVCIIISIKYKKIYMMNYIIYRDKSPEAFRAVQIILIGLVMYCVLLLLGVPLPIPNPRY